MIGHETVLMVLISPALIAWWLCGKFRQPSSRFYLADTPNERSMHSQPVSRSGGLAMVATLLLIWLTLFRQVEFPSIAISVSVLAMAVLGWVDDREHVPAIWRLLAQLLIIAGVLVWGVDLQSVVVFEGVEIKAFIPALIFATLASAWMINLTNFADGVDGYVGGISVIGFATYAMLGWWAGDQAYALFNFSILSAILGFLWWNRPKARLFMGDVGSSVLGLLAALMAWLAQERGIAPAWLIVPIFGVLIADTGVTLIRRLLRGEKVWHAHRQHYYQRARQGGVGPFSLLAWGYALTVLGAVSALLSISYFDNDSAIAIAVLVVVYVSVMNLIDRRWPVVVNNEGVT